MIEALPSASRATALLEKSTLLPMNSSRTLCQTPRLDLHWLHRSGRSAPGDASLILEALVDVALPAGLGHAYVAAEAGVVRRVQELLTERGLPPIRFRPKRSASRSPERRARRAESRGVNATLRSGMAADVE